MRRAPSLIEFPRYPIIAGTALLAVGVTVAWWAKFDVTPLLETPMIRRGELWRLVTSIFPHLDVLHLAFNVYWLWVFGTLLEKTFGHLKTAAFILLFAVGSSSLEFAFSTGGAGLSGVGYGLFGLLWILSRRDQRFCDAIDARTIQLFVAWFFFCIVLTVTNIMPVGNIAHGVGGVLGILTGYVITLPQRRAPFAFAIGAVLVFGVWGATLGRPMVNLSRQAGYEEGKLGYDALVANRDAEAVQWFREAVIYQPKVAGFWYDLGIAQQRQKDLTAALAAYRKAGELGDSQAQNYLGQVYDHGSEGLARKDEAQALLWYRKAADQGVTGAQNNVAWAYATSSDPAIRNPSAALEYAYKAVQATKDKPEPHYLDTLAEAYYVNQKYAEAVAMEQQAIALESRENGSVFEESLKKYQRALDGHRREARKR